MRAAAPVHSGISLLDPRHGQKVFHHVQKPAGVRPDVPHHIALFLGGQRRLVLQIGAAGADNAGQGRAQIVGHGPQQIRADFFFFRLPQLLFLFG